MGEEQLPSLAFGIASECSFRLKAKVDRPRDRFGVVVGAVDRYGLRRPLKIENPMNRLHPKTFFIYGSHSARLLTVSLAAALKVLKKSARKLLSSSDQLASPRCLQKHC